MPLVRPHTLPPRTLFLAQLTPSLIQAESGLKTELMGLQNENEELADTLQAQKEEIERLASGLEAVVEDLEGANSILANSVNGADLRKDIHKIQSKETSGAK